LENVKPPLGFRGQQLADLAGWAGDADDHEFRRLLRGVEAYVPLPTQPAREPQPPPTPSNTRRSPVFAETDVTFREVVSRDPVASDASAEPADGPNTGDLRESMVGKPDEGHGTGNVADSPAHRIESPADTSLVQDGPGTIAASSPSTTPSHPAAATFSDELVARVETRGLTKPTDGNIRWRNRRSVILCAVIIAITATVIVQKMGALKLLKSSQPLHSKVIDSKGALRSGSTEGGVPGVSRPKDVVPSPESRGVAVGPSPKTSTSTASIDLPKAAKPFANSSLMGPRPADNRVLAYWENCG
jgi:hypothetical protein